VGILNSENSFLEWYLFWREKMLNEDRLLLGLKTWLEKLIPLSDNAWEAFTEKGQFHQFKNGDYVFQIGLPETRMHFLRNELVRLFYLREDGKKFNKSFIKSDDVVASIDRAFYNRPPSYSAHCLNDC
jgi:hypothetical protein